MYIAAEIKGGGAFLALSDRIGLVHDVIALARAGLLGLKDALTFLDSFRDEKECKARLSCQ